MTARWLIFSALVAVLAILQVPQAAAQGSVSGESDNAYLYAQWDKNSVPVGGTVNIYVSAYAKYGAITWTDPYARWWVGSRQDFTINGNGNPWATWSFSSAFSGTISFTPQGAGTYDIGFRVYNSAAAETHAISMVVTAYAPAPVITSATSVSLGQNQSYSYSVAATNSPTSYSAANLPPGFSIDTGSGVISGTASTPGSYSSTIYASNVYGTGSASLTWSIVAASIANNPSVSPATITNGGSLTLQPNGSANFGVAWIERTIFPPSGGGISLGNQYGANANAASSYTPIAGLGTYTFLTRVVDNYYNYTDASTTFTVLAPLPAITSPASLNIYFGQSASYQVTATNTPTSFAFAWVTVAPGPASFSSGGLFTSSPIAAGSYSFTVSASNAGGTGSFAVAYTVAKTTPFLSFNSQSFSSTVALSAAQLNATASNPYSGSVAAPTGTITYTVVAVSGANASSTGAVGVGTVLLPGTYTVQASYPGDANYNAAIASVTFTVPNIAPHLASLSATPNTILFGQSSTISATATDPDGNLYAHGLLLLTADGTTWLRPPGTDYSRTGWNAFAFDSADTWTSPSFSNDVPASGSTSTKSVVFMAGAARTYVFHSDAHDGSSWTDNASTYALTVNKTTPVTSFPARSYSSGLPTYTWTNGDANAAFTNPYSPAVAGPSGAVTYSIVGAGTIVQPGMALGPGSYTIRASSVGDSNYNPTQVDTTLNFTQLPPAITSSLSSVGNIGQAFSYQISASNNPTSFGANGTLPAGVTFNAASGILSGIPMAAGNFNLTIRASNAAGTDAKLLQLTISSAAVNSSGTVSFSDAVLGTSTTRITTLSNTGNTSLIVSFVTAYGDQVQGDFAVANAPLTISAGTNANLVVTFTPSSLGMKTGAFVVFDSDSTATPIKYSLTGNGVAVPTYSLTVAAGVGGTASGGGIFPAGTTAIISATPNAGFTFGGWNGSVSSTTNPLGVYMDANKAVNATFTRLNYTLTTAVSGAGALTGGGSYTSGAIASLQAIPAGNGYFIGFSGDLMGAGGVSASNPAPTATLLMDRDKSVMAVFSGKGDQTISFTNPGSQFYNATPFRLIANASSGLPVTLTVVSGPATINGATLALTGALGTVVLQATQPGDRTTNAAAPVSVSFAVINVASTVTYGQSGATVKKADNSGNKVGNANAGPPSRP